jgi:hypothetical protein
MGCGRVLAAWVLLASGRASAALPVVVSSPDGRLRIEFTLRRRGDADAIPHYRVLFRDAEVVRYGRLGLDLGDGTTLGGPCELEGVETRSVHDAVICSEATHRLLQGRFDCVSLGRKKIKGMAQPVELFQVRGVGDWPSCGWSLSHGNPNMAVGVGAATTLDAFPGLRPARTVPDQAARWQPVSNDQRNREGALSPNGITALPSFRNLLRRVGPLRAGQFGLRAEVARKPEQKTLRRELTWACRSSARWALRLPRACRWDRRIQRSGLSGANC